MLSIGSCIISTQQNGDHLFRKKKTHSKCKFDLLGIVNIQYILKFVFAFFGILEYSRGIDIYLKFDESMPLRIFEIFSPRISFSCAGRVF